MEIGAICLCIVHECMEPTTVSLLGLKPRVNFSVRLAFCSRTWQFVIVVRLRLLVPAYTLLRKSDLLNSLNLCLYVSRTIREVSNTSGGSFFIGIHVAFISDQPFGREKTGFKNEHVRV